LVKGKKGTAEPHWKEAVQRWIDRGKKGEKGGILRRREKEKYAYQKFGENKNTSQILREEVLWGGGKLPHGKGGVLRQNCKGKKVYAFSTIYKGL